jgi:hypothetical protein
MKRLLPLWVIVVIWPCIDLALRCKVAMEGIAERDSACIVASHGPIVEFDILLCFGSHPLDSTFFMNRYRIFL